MCSVPGLEIAEVAAGEVLIKQDMYLLIISLSSLNFHSNFFLLMLS